VVTARLLAGSFAVCDGVATWVGFQLGGGNTGNSSIGWLGPAAVATYGVYVAILTRHSANLAQVPRSTSWLLFGLPLCLGLDNLVVGMQLKATGESPLPTALVCGAMSGGLALTGLWIGALMRSRGWFPVARHGDIALILVAGVLVLKESLIDLIDG